MKKTKLRHKIIFKVVGPIMNAYLKKKFNFTYTACDIKPPFLVLANHTIDFDPFFVAKAFNCPIYFVMSDHVASLKAGKLIKHLVSPIPITKSGVDAETTKNVFEIIREGGAVGIFPEGNKSFAGDMSYIKPSTAKLAKRLNVPVVIYRIEGGYFSSPRWTKNKRKGHIHSYVSEIITPEQMSSMTNEQLYEKLVTSLRVNAYEEQEKNLVKFVGTNYAKNIQALLYACPNCGSLCSVYGEGDKIKCSHCDLDAKLNEYGYVENCAFSRLDHWDEFQKSKLKELPIETLPEDKLIFQDTNWEVQQKETKYKSKVIGKFDSFITKNAMILKNQIDEIKIRISEIIGTAIEGACSIQLTLKNGIVYRLKNGENVNGLKYVNLISRIQNVPYKF